MTNVLKYPVAITSDESEGQYLTIVYKNISSGEEARLLGSHPKVSAISWSHALHERDKTKLTLELYLK